MYQRAIEFFLKLADGINLTGMKTVGGVIVTDRNKYWPIFLRGYFIYQNV